MAMRDCPAAADPAAHAPAALHSGRQHGPCHRLLLPPARHSAVASRHGHRPDALGAALRDADHPDRMSTFDPAYLEAARLCGATRWQAFRDIELPLIWPGIFGAAIFSLILSVNETVRTASSRAVQHDADLYLVDLQAGRPVAGALRADEPADPRDARDFRDLPPRR